MLATVVEGVPKVPFSVAITPRHRGGRYSVPWIDPPYLWSLPYNAECQARQYQVPFFESLVWLDLGWNPSFLDHGLDFANGPADLGSIPGRVIPKTLKMVLDTSLLNTQQYKVCIKNKVEQSSESPPLHLSVVAIKKGAFWLLLTTVANKD